jgi:DNA polymerase-1
VLVSRSNFDLMVAKLSVSGLYGLDTETFGLARTDRLFSIIFADELQGYYFNFQPYPGLSEEWVLPRAWVGALSKSLYNPESTFFIHNAKFDMGMLAREGVWIKGKVHCTQSIERVIRNNLLGGKPYSLESCAERRGLKKDDSVEKYIKEHKLSTKVKVPGKDKLIERKHYDKVPWEIITKYGETDATLVRAIGIDQLKQIAKIDQESALNHPRLVVLVENELELTKVCFDMEETGIRIDRPYVERALEYELKQAESAEKDFKALTGVEFQDSAIVFKEAFKKLGIELPLTKTGKPSTRKEVLEELDNPIAEKIREVRKHAKLASTYYSSFLYFADKEDRVHANIRQGGTETGRFSYSDPNLQNLPKEDEEEDRLKPFHVRRSFIPDPDCCFVPIDYKQQEFRMMLDYAGEKALIDAVMDGMDVHDATGELLGISRKPAKTLNFGLLYGMGNGSLAKKLKLPLNEAKELKEAFFGKLPKVKRFIHGVTSTGLARGYIYNWFGFRNHLFSPEYAYILPNHLIQGGCAQVIRRALVLLFEYIIKQELKTRILTQVHDELLFQIPRREIYVVPELQKLMEDVYQPKNGMKLLCSVEHSWKSWGKFDQEKGYPQ